MQTTATRLPLVTLPFSLALALLCAGTAFGEEQGIRPGEVKGFAESTFNSPVFKDLVAGYQQQNTSVVKSITTDVVERTKALLPKANQLGERLRYGDHNVVSNDGEAVVMWMIEAANATPERRKALLEKLAGLSARGIPEAQTFEGFVAEYGLFGSQKDLGSAVRMYRSAAAQNYQPAVYNLAIAAAYGKLQQPDVTSARSYASQAAAIAPDASYRVCGFASFLSYRQDDRARAMQYAQSCWSDLAGIAKAQYDGRVTTAERVTMLRNSIGTGLDDGYSLLEKITREVGAEPQYLACKYALVNRYRQSRVKNTLRDDAVRCYRQYGVPTDPKEAALRFNMVVPAIIGFVPTEIRALEKLRASNKFHYGWSVPYLPFRQQDVDLFAPFVTHTKQ